MASLVSCPPRNRPGDSSRESGECFQVFHGVAPAFGRPEPLQEIASGVPPHSVRGVLHPAHGLSRDPRLPAQCSPGHFSNPLSRQGFVPDPVPVHRYSCPGMASGQAGAGTPAGPPRSAPSPGLCGRSEASVVCEALTRIPIPVPASSAPDPRVIRPTASLCPQS